MLALMPFCVQMCPRAAMFWRVYIWPHSVFEVDVLFLSGEEWHGWTDRYGDQKSQGSSDAGLIGLRARTLMSFGKRQRLRKLLPESNIPCACNSGLQFF
jgi:hypothetical protein